MLEQLGTEIQQRGLWNWRRRSQRFFIWFSLGLITLSLIIGLVRPAGVMALPEIQLPLSTRRTEIVDARGRAVLLRGVNWFGMETETNVPHGLWVRDYKDFLSQIKQQGYNIIRLPYSVQALGDNRVSGIDYGLPGNADLQGKTPLEVMDAIVQEAGRQGLMVLLDSHRLNNQRIPELWYGDGFTEADWINAWTMLAERYRNQPNVIGADLKNEPYGRASWGTGDRATDWRLAAERAGNAILKVNPNWLIVVEGVEKNVPGQRLKRHWMGGNLEGVRRFPVRLSVRNRVVYSPHEYGAGVFDQPWFNEKAFPKNLSDRWETGFHYIVRQGIAPVWVGEFGGRQTDEKSKEGIWQRQFVQYLRQNRLGFAYWSWNPNSGDTGGLLQDDWKTLVLEKRSLLNSLLPATLASVVPSASLPTMRTPATVQPSTPVSSAPPNASPQPSSSKPQPLSPSPITTGPAPVASRSPVSGGSVQGLQLKPLVQSDWQAGFCMSLQVSNPGQQTVRNWGLRFTLPQAQVDQRWNGQFDRQGNEYQVTPADWAKTLEGGRSVDLGFCAQKMGGDYLPRDFRIVALP
ncbi:MAG: cellulase family glycosylhydrolase [Synechococcales bacterium]|nr:cellulase family glycosylhydrolase [Synechococcales bacterium]